MHDSNPHAFTRWLMAGLLALGTTAWSADLPALKDAFKDHFLVGTAINRALVTGTGFRRNSEQLKKDTALVKEQFNQLVAENEMKWALIHPEPGANGYDFDLADGFVNFGLSNHMYLVGHTLVWHAQTPTWVFAGTNPPPPGVTNAAPSRLANTNAAMTNRFGRGRFGRGFGGGFFGRYTGPRASREELLQRMRDHIHTVVGRYKGKIKVWDVVNEAISDDGTNLLRNSLWLEIIGPDFIAKAFEYAHEADPDAILRYNDYGLESPAKRRKLVTLIKSLQEQKVPVMAIGSQAHLNVSTSFEDMDQALTEMATLGLPIHITELDVNGARGGQRSFGADIADNAATTQGGLVDDANQRLADAYAGLFRAFLKHDQHVKMVTFWGANDANSWRANGKPLLFDGDSQPKPAFHAVIAEVKKAAGEFARNPIIHADVPDIAVIRVGDTYYMSSTTMHLSPGLPIMKSKDLVNWRLVSYAYDTLTDNDALTLQNGRSAYGAGSWASSLRYHDGTFYATTFSSTSGKTHVYRTKDIEKGPWTENSFRPSLHDHSLFFDDDGRVYMIYGAGNLRLVELNKDLSGLKPDGINQVVITNASRVAGPNIGLPAEGSQLRKIDGKYYLFNITWPRGGMRTVVIHRADKITGPYEGRVALQDKGVAQGGLIDTPQGDWYACLFRDCGAVGRIPYLVPVKWEDGWPVLGVDGKVPDTLNLPGNKGLIPGIVASDEFDRRPGDPALPLVWQWNHNPDNKLWSLTQRPGFLRLTTGRIDADFLKARNTLTQRTIGPECSGTTALDVTHMKDGDFAGLALLQKQYGLVGVKSDGGTNFIVMLSAKSGSPVEAQTVPLIQKTVYLKAECDFKDRADTAHFFYSLDGRSWTSIGSELKMAYTLPHFMGYRFGLFNYATRTAGGFVDFDYFRVSDKMTGAN